MESNQLPEQKKSSSQKNMTIFFVVAAGVSLFLCLCCAMAAIGVVLLKPSTETVDRTNWTEPIQPDDDEQENLAQSVIEKAEEIRGLHAMENFRVVYMTEDELREKLTQDFVEATDQDYADEHDLLSLLGFLPPDFDLRQFYADFYAEQIAGYYDRTDNEMILVEGTSDTDQSLTLAHEYTHFLQYNVFDLENSIDYNDETCMEDPEYCLAISAVLEGDATLTEILISSAPGLNLFEKHPSSTDMTVFDSAPKYFQDYLLFPYHYGVDFVGKFYRDGGFDEVNKLYLTPPNSIEQIMHPEKYPLEQPVPVTIAPFEDKISDSCEILTENVLNEADLLWILTSGYQEKWQLPVETARSAAEGWGGGKFIFARCDGEPLFFSKTVWDTPADAVGYADALSQHLGKRLGKQTSDSLWVGDGLTFAAERVDDTIYYVITPDTFEIKQVLDLIHNSWSF